LTRARPNVIFASDDGISDKNSGFVEMKVLILCGGKGLRLRPFSENIPKPMIPVKGKPLLEHIMDYFQKYGHTNFVLAIGYKGKVIRDYFSRVKDKTIEYVDSGDVDILKRINDAKNYVGGRFILAYGDTLADVNIRSLLRYHSGKHGLVTLTSYRMQSPFGIVVSRKDGRVTEFKEKPFLDHWINIGFMVFEKEALDLIGHEDNLASFLAKLAKAQKLYDYKHKGKHITINTDKEKDMAEREIDGFYTVGGVFHEK
jgi:glucose-1-phosphate cytidylyltransferase